MNSDVLGQQAPRSRLLPRFLFFALAIVLVVGTLSARLFQLQIGQGGYYDDLAPDNRLAFVPVRSSRGLIYDRAGRLLVTNVPAFVVKIKPSDLPYSRREEVVGRLSALLDLPAATLNETLDRKATIGSRFDPVTIASDVPTEVARIISEEHGQLPGVEVTVEARREYPFGPLVSHVLGFTGAVSGEDLARLEDVGYLADDVIGRAGVEAV